MDEEDEIPQDEDLTQDYTAEGEEGDSTQQDYEDYDVTERDLAEEDEVYRLSSKSSSKTRL